MDEFLYFLLGPILAFAIWALVMVGTVLYCELEAATNETKTEEDGDDG